MLPPLVVVACVRGGTLSASQAEEHAALRADPDSGAQVLILLFQDNMATPNAPILALQLVSRVQRSDIQCALLQASAMKLPDELLPQALDAAQNEITEAACRAIALGCLSDRQSQKEAQSTLDVAIAAAGNALDEADSVRAIRDLAPRLQELHFEHALDVVLSLRRESDRMEALEALAPYLNKDQAIRAYRPALRVENQVDRARGITALLPVLPLSVVDRIASAVKDFTDPSLRDLLLMALYKRRNPFWVTGHAGSPSRIPQSADEIRDDTVRILRLRRACKTLAEAESLGDPEDRVEALLGLTADAGMKFFSTPYVTAISAIRNISDATARHKAAVLIVECLPRNDELYRAVLAAVRELRDPHTRADLLVLLAPLMPDDETAAILAEALTDGGTIGDGAERCRLFVALANTTTNKTLSASAQHKAIEAARTINDLRIRGSELAMVASCFPGAVPLSVLEEALDSAFLAVLEDRDPAASAVLALVPHLPASLLGTALDAATSLPEESRAGVLSALATRAEGKLLINTVVLARAIKADDARMEALVEMVPLLSLEDAIPLLPELERAPELAAKALVKLGERCPPGRLKEVLAATRFVCSSVERATAIIHIFSSSPDNLGRDALEAAFEVTDAAVRARLFGDLARQLVDPLRERALEAGTDAVAQIAAGELRAAAISALAPQLTDRLLHRALELSNTIGNDQARASAVTALSLHIPASLVPTALQMAREMAWKLGRADALVALAEKLPEELAPEAIVATAELADGHAQRVALQALAPRLQGELLSAALDIARTIAAGLERAEALSALALRMPDKGARLLLAEAIETTSRDHNLLAGRWASPGSVVRVSIPLVAIDRGTTAIDTRWWGIKREQEDYLTPVEQPGGAKTTEELLDAAELLVRLAIQAPEDLAVQAFSLALGLTEAIEDPVVRSTALAKMIKSLPHSLREGAVKTAIAAAMLVKDLVERVDVLTDLAAQLPAEAAVEAMAAALEVAHSITSPELRAEALSTLLPRLPSALLASALSKIKETQDLNARSALVVSLALVADRDLQAECIRIALNDFPELPRTRLLSQLLPLLPVLHAHAGDEGLTVLFDAVCDTADWQP